MATEAPKKKKCFFSPKENKTNTNTKNKKRKNKKTKTKKQKQKKQKKEKQKRKQKKENKRKKTKKKRREDQETMAEHVDIYDGLVSNEEVAMYPVSAQNVVKFGKTRRITVEERDELKRKCDEMADECVARNKRGIACEEERKRCKRRVYPRLFNAPTFYERLDHFLYTAAERTERTEEAKEERRAREKREASEAKKEAKSNEKSNAKSNVKSNEKSNEKSSEEKRVLRMLKLFLARNGASMATVETTLLTELERDFMPHVRARVPSTRLVGVPRGLGDEWPTYVYLYCLYLVEVGALGSEGASADGKDTTLFVSVPSGPSGPHGPHGPSGPHGLRVCLLRFDAEGRMRLSY